MKANSCKCLNHDGLIEFYLHCKKLKRNRALTLALKDQNGAKKGAWSIYICTEKGACFVILMDF